jgi:hypothetical protein
VTVAYIDLVAYLSIAAEVTGLDAKTLIRVTKLDLADSLCTLPNRLLAHATAARRLLYDDGVDGAAARLRVRKALQRGDTRAIGRGSTLSEPPEPQPVQMSVCRPAGEKLSI